MKLLQIPLVSAFSIVSIESFQWIQNIPIILKFSGQSIIGILTIIFLINKILLINDIRKNKKNEKNINIS